MKKIRCFALAVVTLLFSGVVATQVVQADSEKSESYSLKYEWPEKPKVGDHILKVEVFQGKEKVSNVEVVVSYDMPSMRGHHDTTGKMKQNKKGDYLLPINFAMRGDWEIVVSVQKDKTEVAREIFLLEI